MRPIFQRRYPSRDQRRYLGVPRRWCCANQDHQEAWRRRASRLAQYRELAAFAQFASDLDEATRKQLERGRLVTELMKQAQYAPLSVSEMAFTLFGVSNGYFDDVPVAKALAAEKALHKYMSKPTRRSDQAHRRHQGSRKTTGRAALR